MPKSAYKRCTKCEETKPLDDFQRNRSSKDGRQTWCKTCIAEANRSWRERNPEAHRAAEHRWRAANIGRKKDTNRRWREENYDRVLETGRGITRRYRERHPKKDRARAALNAAVQRGEIIRPDHCERCGAKDNPARDGRTQIHGHHRDYSKALDVEWLCRRCHTAADEKVADA